MLSACLGLAAACPAAAQPVPSDAIRAAAPIESNQPLPGPTGAPAPAVSERTSLWERSNLLGNLGGLRESLGNSGISYGLQETEEVLGNPTGGRRQGVIYEGLTEASLGVNLGKLLGLVGGVFNVSAFEIHGRGLSINNLDNLNAVSSIEAARSTRLYELWYGQAFLGGKLNVRVGQIGIDQEFMISQYSGALMNATAFGFPLLPSVDLPSGGPVYPLSALGVRARWSASDALTLLAGIFDGNPAGRGLDNPQRRDASGTLFRLEDGVLAITEMQYATGGGGHSAGLPGTYKLGAWYETNSTFNEPFGGAGQPLARTGHAKALRDDYSVYVLADQLASRRPGTADQGLGTFLRAMGAPGDRNLISFFADAGLTFKGLVPGRPGDTAAVGFGIGRIGTAERQLDAIARVPIRGSERVVELTYQVQVTRWWLVQPDFQYVLSPGGGILNPDNLTYRIGDAAVLGLRTSIAF